VYARTIIDRPLQQDQFLPTSLIISSGIGRLRWLEFRKNRLERTLPGLG
jgi:hypothetical protein